jgi:hypothetical protein
MEWSIEMEVEQVSHVRGLFEKTFTREENGTPLAITNEMSKKWRRQLKSGVDSGKKYWYIKRF